jgi:hypothetical protein
MSIIENPNGVEEIFCQPFDKLQQKAMSQEQFKLMFMLCDADKRGVFPTTPDKEKPFQLQLLEKRLEHCFTFKIPQGGLRLFIASLGESAGGVVMYLTYLQYKCKHLGVKELDWDVFSMQIFPMGFPSEEARHKVWLGQKIKSKSGSDNLVDYQSAMKSIQF